MRFLERDVSAVRSPTDAAACTAAHKQFLGHNLGHETDGLIFAPRFHVRLVGAGARTRTRARARARARARTWARAGTGAGRGGSWDPRCEWTHGKPAYTWTGL